jgi:hypothetical protein
MLGMGAGASPRSDRPLAFALATAGIAVVVTGSVLVWAQVSPETVLIGLEGRHDHATVGGSERLAACLDCHVPFVGTPGSRCLGPGCHGELATGTPPQDGKAMPIRFHAAVRDQPCGLCHLEHVNPGTRTATRAFRHAIIPQPTRDRCTRCHSGSVQANHPTTDAVNCDLCHGTKSWRGLRIDHSRVRQHPCDLCHAAPLDTTHASVAGTCNECHDTNTWRSKVIVVKPLARPNPTQKEKSQQRQLPPEDQLY